VLGQLPSKDANKELESAQAVR